MAVMLIPRTLACLLLIQSFSVADDLPEAGLLLDLDASKNVELDATGRVVKWTGSSPGQPFEFSKRDEGRAEPGSGRPALRPSVAEIGAQPALVFLQQELVCRDEDAFDSLTTGQGHTWAALVSVREQRVGVVDVNSFFGNLHNAGNYEGLWGCFTDDRRPWYGVRNGRSFGRFDANNPQLLAPPLEVGRYHLLVGRMQTGTGKVRLDFFVDSATPASTAAIQVSSTANPSKLAIGQERDAIEHPGHESFDGEIARLLIWQRPLDDTELASLVALLKKRYRPVGP